MVWLIRMDSVECVGNVPSVLHDRPARPQRGVRTQSAISQGNKKKEVQEQHKQEVNPGVTPISHNG
jgi:hypothetical protein